MTNNHVSGEKKTVSVQTFSCLHFVQPISHTTIVAIFLNQEWKEMNLVDTRRDDDIHAVVKLETKCGNGGTVVRRGNLMSSRRRCATMEEEDSTRASTALLL